MSESMLLCVGLRGGRHGGTIAPRLVTEEGEITLAEGLPPWPAVPATLGQRVTYLANVLGTGLYGCEVVEQPVGVEVPIVYPIAVPTDRVPAWARDLFAEKGWSAP